MAVEGLADGLTCFHCRLVANSYIILLLLEL